MREDGGEQDCPYDRHMMFPILGTDVVADLLIYIISCPRDTLGQTKWQTGDGRMYVCDQCLCTFLQSGVPGCIVRLMI
jgi:hypothetical protein